MVRWRLMQSAIKMEFKRYKVLFCAHCHNVQMCSSKEALKCLKCGKSSPFKIDGQRIGYLWDTDSPQEASEIVRNLKEKTKELKA